MYINPTTINEAYESCRLRRHESRTGAVAVPGFLATAHALNRRKLSHLRDFLICALKKLPRNIRRSTGCTGVPWIAARHFVQQEREYSLEVLDRLLAMAVASELVTVVHPEGAVCDLPYIIIEDERASKISRAERSYKNAKWD